MFNDRVYNGLLKLSLRFEAESGLPAKQLYGIFLQGYHI